VLAPIGCVSVTHYEPCSQERTCRFRRVFLEIRNHTAWRLDRLSLADLVAGDPVTRDEMLPPELDAGVGI
jgi:DNA-binding IscR family transcriptional regulator